MPGSCSPHRSGATIAINFARQVKYGNIGPFLGDGFMATVAFDRDSMAKWYAKQHLQTDPGLREIYYLTKDAPDREIRFVEINELIAEMNDDAFRTDRLRCRYGSGFGTQATLAGCDACPMGSYSWWRSRPSGWFDAGRCQEARENPSMNKYQEYPWPHHAPAECPARHQFELWGQLTGTGLGHQLLKVVQSAVHRFPAYG